MKLPPNVDSQPTLTLFLFTRIYHTNRSTRYDDPLGEIPDPVFDFSVDRYKQDDTLGAQRDSHILTMAYYVDADGTLRKGKAPMKWSWNPIELLLGAIWYILNVIYYFFATMFNPVRCDDNRTLRDTSTLAGQMV